MTLKLVQPAPEEPVSLEELRVHLRIDGHEEDADLALKLLAAHRHVADAELGGRALITSTWKMMLAAWPCLWVDVPLGNLQSVESIKYTTPDGVQHALPADNYKPARTYTPASAGVTGDLDSDAGLGRIHPAYGCPWPAETLDVGEPIEITFTCGWDSAANVPAPIKAAILLVAGHLYEHREAVIAEGSVIPRAMEMAVSSMCSRYADRRF